MKNNVILLIGTVVVVAVAAAFFLFRGGKEPSTVTAITSVPALRATTLAPDMTLIVASSTTPLLIASTTDANVGDTLTTSHNGRGLLQETNGTEILLDYDTTFTLTKSDDSGTHVSGFLGTGAMWARVKKVFGKGEYYEIKTQNAVAIVRGTSFGLSYKNGISKLQVATGTVGLMPVDFSTGEPIESREASVSGGNKATIDRSGVVSVSALTSADKKAEWYLFNVSSDVNKPEVPTSAASTNEVPAPKTASPAAPQATSPSPSVAAPKPKPTSSESTAPPPVANTENASNACATFSELQGTNSTKDSLTLTSVKPSSISQSSQGIVTLTGDGFDCVTTITIGDNTLSGESDFTVANNSRITFSSSLLPIGTFDITMDDTFENTVTLPKAITVTQ